MSEKITLKVEETIVYTFVFDADQIPPTVDPTDHYELLEWGCSSGKINYSNGESLGKGNVYLESDDL